MNISYFELNFRRGSKFKTVELSCLDDVSSLIDYYLRDGWHLCNIQFCISFDKFFNKQF